MKNFVPFFIALMIMTSCASTSSDLGITQNNEAYTEEVTYYLTLPTELFEVADVEVTYAGNNGVLVTKTITQDKTVPLWAYHGSAYRTPGTDSTHVIWENNVTMDSIPARAFISPRLIAKPCADEYKDKRYTMFGNMGFLYDSGLEVLPEYDPNPNDGIVPHQIYGKDGVFMHCIDVRGSNMGSFIDMDNDNPQALDCTIRPEKPGSKKLHAEYND